jgi:hypothetical protein
MKNPTRWIDRTIRSTAKGVGEAGQRVKDAATGLRGTIDRTMAKAPPVAIEALTIWIRHLILAAFEVTIGWLVRRLIARAKPSNVISFPALRPAS